MCLTAITQAQITPPKIIIINMYEHQAKPNKNILTGSIEGFFLGQLEIFQQREAHTKKKSFIKEILIHVKKAVSVLVFLTVILVSYFLVVGTMMEPLFFA